MCVIFWFVVGISFVGNDVKLDWDAFCKPWTIWLIESWDNSACLLFVELPIILFFSVTFKTTLFSPFNSFGKLFKLVVPFYVLHQFF